MQAAHRKHTFIIAVLYKLWPRFAFFYIHTFSYDGVFLPLLQRQFYGSPAQSEGDTQQGEAIHTDIEIGWAAQMLFLSEILVMPHIIIIWFALVWWWEHPWICTAVAVHCALAMYREIVAAISIAINSQTWKYHYLR